MRWLVLAAWSCAAAMPSHARAPVYGPNLEGFAYPYAVQVYRFRTQAQAYAMAYMDVAPDASSHGPGAGRTVVLLHGLNFCGATWAATVAKLHGAGFRVVVPEQLGFCKSSKPVNYQYSFQQLAMNTRLLLDSIKAGRIILVGHSMGGMLAARYALMFPQDVTELVLVDPLGLEDWKAEGVLYLAVDERYALELENTAPRIERYELTDYYGGHWKPSYDIWVKLLASLYTGGGRERYAWNQALISDMIFTQPVLYELDRLAMPTVILVGTLDRAEPFRDTARPEVAARLGDYPDLARRAARRIPSSRVIELEGVGHVPQIEAPDRFNEALLQAIERPPEAHRPGR
ncbi:MAG: alpha/beta hydrolase [Steroidobacteraceae bacterium]